MHAFSFEHAHSAKRIRKGMIGLWVRYALLFFIGSKFVAFSHRFEISLDNKLIVICFPLFQNENWTT